MTKSARTTIAYYCTCGGAWTGSGFTADDEAKLRAAWDANHSGEGHAPVTARQAAAARRKHDFGDVA